jgi:hypothetical protein
MRSFLNPAWWKAFQKKLEKRLAARAKIIGQERQSVSLTLDSTWRDLDLTTQTSAKAKWAIIFLEFSGGTTHVVDIEWRMKGRSTTDMKTEFREVGSGNKAMTWQFKIELDDDQICQYNGASAGTVNAYVTGYIESGRQWA